jgi:hypothetical protein
MHRFGATEPVHISGAVQTPDLVDLRCRHRTLVPM